jgi:hypothetical protein
VCKSDLGRREERRLEQRESGRGSGRRRRRQQRHPGLPHGRRRWLRRLLQRLGAAPERGRAALGVGGEEGAGVVGAALLRLGVGVVVVALDGRAQRSPPPRPHLSLGFFTALLAFCTDLNTGWWLVLAPQPQAHGGKGIPNPTGEENPALSLSAAHSLHHNLSCHPVLSSRQLL